MQILVVAGCSCSHRTCFCKEQALNRALLGARMPDLQTPAPAGRGRSVVEHCVADATTDEVFSRESVPISFSCLSAQHRLNRQPPEIPVRNCRNATMVASTQHCRNILRQSRSRAEAQIRGCSIPSLSRGEWDPAYLSRDIVSLTRYIRINKL